MRVESKFLLSSASVVIAFFFLCSAAAYTATEPTLTINQHKITIEIAATKKEQEQGLMFRKHLDVDGRYLYSA
jgi:Uncharacterized ACR, COG1430